MAKNTLFLTLLAPWPGVARGWGILLARFCCHFHGFLPYFYLILANLRFLWVKKGVWVPKKWPKIEFFVKICKQMIKTHPREICKQMIKTQPREMIKTHPRDYDTSQNHKFVTLLLFGFLLPGFVPNGCTVVRFNLTILSYFILISTVPVLHRTFQVLFGPEYSTQKRYRLA